jgi:hypothetical protein
VTSTLHSPTLAIPDGSPGIECEIVEPRRTELAVSDFATLVALAAFTTSPATMIQTVASLGGGTAGLTWGLSAMGSVWPRRCCRSVIRAIRWLQSVDDPPKGSDDDAQC